MKEAECAEGWVVRGADHAAAEVAVEVAGDLAVGEADEVRAEVKRNAIASTSQLIFRTFLTMQISAGLSAI